MRFHIITLFAGAFDSYLGESILKRAIAEKKIKVEFYNPRDFVQAGKRNKKQMGDVGFFRETKIDDKPYAGGPGMVVQAEPVIKAIDAIMKKIEKRYKKAKDLKHALIIWLSPSGKQFDTSYAKKITKKYSDIVIVCGRYEGIDARVKKVFKMEEVSIGPFVLTGGELPAMIMIDCVSRQVQGVLGNFDSREEERVSSSDVYTRPEIIEHKGRKYRVPKVLLSGDQKKVEEWKKNH